VLDGEGQRLALEFEGEDGPNRFWNQIESYRLESSFLVPTDRWEVVVYSHTDPAFLRRRFRPWVPVILHINGQPQLRGRIETTEGVGDSGAQLRVSGYDYLYDLSSGGVDPSLRFSDQMTCEQAILSILKPYGIAKIDGEGYDRARKLLTGKANTHVGKRSKKISDAKRRAIQLRGYKADYDEGASELANRVAARHGLMLQPSVDRDTICLVSPDYDQEAHWTLRRSPADGGQVVTASAKRDWSQVPTVTIAVGRGGDAGNTIGGLRFEKGTFGEESLLPSLAKNAEIIRIVHGEGFDDPLTIPFRFNPKHAAPGNVGLVYRPMFFHDRDSRTQDHLEAVTRRMVSEKVRATLEYSCTVQGHADLKTGAVYGIDTIGRVLDGVEDVEEELWVTERTFYNDGNSGPMTDMQLIRPDSFLIQE